MVDITQKEIMRNWDAKYEGKPLVSIKSLVYNHERYIENTLDGFLMQKTNSKYEIIIHDDCSTDGTTEIIREYASKYPDIFVPLNSL